jgi:carbamoyl-phosphate synthase large subunit
LLVDKLKLRQPKNGIAYSIEQALLASEEIGFPIVVRPSYVLGGRAMAIIPDQATLKDYFDTTLAAFVPQELQHRFAGNRRAQVNAVLAKNALLLDSYVRDAIEADVDAICDGKDVFIAGVMEHIEEAGVHSGDSACSLPPHSLGAEMLAELERQTADIARAQGRGPHERAICD